MRDSRRGLLAIPPPQRRKSAAGPPRKGAVWSLLLRHDETCDSVAAAQKRPAYIKARGMRGAKRPRPVFSGQPLGAPLAASLPPLFPAYHLFRMAKGPQIWTLSLPTQAGEKKRLEVARCSGREGLSPPVLGNGSHLSRLSSSAAAQPHMTETA